MFKHLAIYGKKKKLFVSSSNDIQSHECFNTYFKKMNAISKAVGVGEVGAA